jgi:hypothetical protein
MAGQKHSTAAFAYALLPLLITGLCSALLLSGEANARQRQTTATTGNGQTATRDVTRQDGDVSSTTTGPNGKTSNRTVDRSATETTATTTGPNGKAANRKTTRSKTGSTTNVTGPGGKTGSAVVTH